MQLPASESQPINEDKDEEDLKTQFFVSFSIYNTPAQSKCKESIFSVTAMMQSKVNFSLIHQHCCLDELESMLTGKLQTEPNEHKISRVENVISKFKSLCFEVVFNCNCTTDLYWDKSLILLDLKLLGFMWVR